MEACSPLAQKDEHFRPVGEVRPHGPISFAQTSCAAIQVSFSPRIVCIVNRHSRVSSRPTRSRIALSRLAILKKALSQLDGLRPLALCDFVRLAHPIGLPTVPENIALDHQ